MDRKLLNIPIFPPSSKKGTSMPYKKTVLAVIISAFFGLLACSDNSSTSLAAGDTEFSIKCDNKTNTCDQTDKNDSSSSKNMDNAKSSSSKAKSYSSEKESNDIGKEDTDNGENIESSESNEEDDNVESSSSKTKISSSQSEPKNSDKEDTDNKNVESSESKVKEDNIRSSSSSVEIDPEAFNGANLEQCKGKSNGTKVNIGGIPFTCMNGEMMPDEDGINELIGNKYKGCDDSKIEDNVWIFYSSPMGSWNTEKIKWLTETSYEYTTFPVPPNQIEAFEELEDLGLGPDKQTIEGKSREEVYTKYCGK